MAQRCSEQWIRNKTREAIPDASYTDIDIDTPFFLGVVFAPGGKGSVVDKYNEIKAQCDRQKAEKKIAEISAKTTKTQLTPVLGAIDARFNSSWVIGGIAIILVAAAGYYFYDLTK